MAGAGDDGSLEAFSVRAGQLRCYRGLESFAPVTLSNGFTFTPYSKLGDLFEQALLCIQQNQTADIDALGTLFDRLNGNDPLGGCR